MITAGIRNDKNFPAPGGTKPVLPDRGAGFSELLLMKAAEKTNQSSEPEALGRYIGHLKEKYGNVRFESIPKDQKALEKAGKRMSGNDVVIAPNILTQMASDPEKARYYEKKIDYFFETVIPQGNAICAAKGLVFEPCGVVVHEDGTVTYICGCSDSPERVAKVNAINRARDQKRAAMREESIERALETANRQKQLLAASFRGRSVEGFLNARRQADPTERRIVTFTAEAAEQAAAAYDAGLTFPLIEPGIL